MGVEKIVKICLITAGQPSTDPRLVKEADALTEAGYEVRVVASYLAAWALEFDEVLLASRKWTCRYVESGRRFTSFPALMRLALHRWLRALSALWWHHALDAYLIPPITKQLINTVRHISADLYIAHNVAALAAAAVVVREKNALLAYDAEDFLPGIRRSDAAPSPVEEADERLEAQLLPLCAYITAASAGIAEAYRTTYEIEAPKVILNVFPLHDRPTHFRPTDLHKSLTLYWFSQTIGPDRGLEDILRAMGLVRDSELHLHLQGRWKSGYREEMYSTAAAYGVPPQQIHDHTPAPPESLPRIAGQYDVGLALEQPVSINRDICLTNKIFTYILAGNAVVATATTGQRSLMEALPGAGFCYEPGDVETLAIHLRTWLHDRSALDDARRKAWSAALQQYNWDHEKHRLIDIVGTSLKD